MHCEAQCKLPDSVIAPWSPMQSAILHTPRRPDRGGVGDGTVLHCSFRHPWHCLCWYALQRHFRLRHFSHDAQCKLPLHTSSRMDRKFRCGTMLHCPLRHLDHKAVSELPSATSKRDKPAQPMLCPSK